MEEGISNSSARGGEGRARGAKLYRGTWKREREGILAPRGFVKDDGGDGSGSSSGGVAADAGGREGEEGMPLPVT